MAVSFEPLEGFWAVVKKPAAAAYAAIFRASMLQHCWLRNYRALFFFHRLERSFPFLALNMQYCGKDIRLQERNMSNNDYSYCVSSPAARENGRVQLH